MNIQKYFWAKITSEGKPGISVLEHMINVGNVAQSISEHSIDLLHRFNLSSEEIGALAALHDLGKISPGFQMKCDAWLHENNFHDIAKNNVWDTQMETDHGKVSHSALQIFLNEISLDSNIAKYVSAVLGAHHGRLNPPNDRGFKPCGAITENKTGIDWNTERELAAKTIWEIFKAHDINALSDTSPVLWWLAGLTSVADWIGSDERFFSSSKQVELISKKVIALNALDHIGFRNPKINGGLTFHDLFHDTNRPEVQWVPNEMQKKTITMITGPGVYVIEAPMGMGKTEAAQWAAYHLLAKGLAKGIYFALPTQATSNRIHIRMNEFVKRISPECNGSRLTHKVDNEIDFFAAVDDLNKNETGAGMTSTLEFNSATYYRFAALNLDMLANEEHLGDYTAADGTFICNVETRKKVVRAFLKSTILAIPSARKTTMNGNTLPAYVLGIIREKGHPIQLVNAFEIPVYSKQGYLIESINRLIDEYSDLCKTWCIGGEVFKKAVIKESLKSELKDKTDGIVTCSFDNLIEGMVTHVK